MSKTTENQGFSYDPVDHGLDQTEKAYRSSLGDGLEAVLKTGADDLTAIVRGLNELNVHGPKGQPWTEELLEAELNRLSG